MTVCPAVSYRLLLVEAGVDIDFPAFTANWQVWIPFCRPLPDAATARTSVPEREGNIVTIFRRTGSAPYLDKPSARQILRWITIPIHFSADNGKLFPTGYRKLNGSIDKIGVIDAFERGRGGSRIHPFRTIAENFRMIDNDTHSLYSVEGRLLNELIERSFAMVRALKTSYRQRAVRRCGCMMRIFQALYDAGALTYR